MIKIDKNQFHLANQFQFNGIVKKGQRYMTYKSDWMNCKMMTLLFLAFQYDWLNDDDVISSLAPHADS